jgi:hypothetical protein
LHAKPLPEWPSRLTGSRAECRRNFVCRATQPPSGCMRSISGSQESESITKLSLRWIWSIVAHAEPSATSVISSLHLFLVGLPTNELTSKHIHLRWPTWSRTSMNRDGDQHGLVSDGLFHQSSVPALYLGITLPLTGTKSIFDTRPELNPPKHWHFPGVISRFRTNHTGC